MRALEASANADTVTVLTARGSTLHTVLKKQENAQFLLLTNLAFSPKTDKYTEEISIPPANNTSLLLDTLNKTARSHPDKNFNLVFESLTSLILQVGFEKTHNFVRYALEILSSVNATAIFPFNPSAHDEKIVKLPKTLMNAQADEGS